MHLSISNERSMCSMHVDVILFKYYMSNTIHLWAFWTNLFFLIPLYIAISNRSWLHAFFILATMTFSFLYHLHDGQNFATEDQMTAVALIAVNSVLLINGLVRQNHHWWFWITLATASLALVLLYTEAKFPESHGVWHILSAMVTVFCQFFFLGL